MGRANDVADGSEYREFMFIPYKDRGRTMGGADCWGLTMLLIEDRLGVSLPRYEGELNATPDLIEEEAERSWHLLDYGESPQAWDIVVMRVGKDPRWHICAMISPTKCITTSTAGIVTTDIDRPAIHDTRVYRHASR